MNGMKDKDYAKKDKDGASSMKKILIILILIVGLILLVDILHQRYGSYVRESEENYCRDACTDIANRYPEGHRLRSMREKLTYEECYEQCMEGMREFK